MLLKYFLSKKVEKMTKNWAHKRKVAVAERGASFYNFGYPGGYMRVCANSRSAVFREFTVYNSNLLKMVTENENGTKIEKFSTKCLNLSQKNRN